MKVDVLPYVLGTCWTVGAKNKEIFPEAMQPGYIKSFS